MKAHRIIDYFIYNAQYLAVEKMAHARNVAWAALLSLISSPFFISLYWFLHYSQGIHIVLIEMLLMACLLLILKFTRYVFLARQGVLVVLVMLFGSISFYQGGLIAPSIVWFSLIPLVALFMGGYLAGIMWSVFVLCLLGMTYALHMSGFIFPFNQLAAHRELLEISSIVGLVIVLFGIVLFFESSKHQGFFELGIALKKIERLAAHDSLTGIYNRHHILNFLISEMQRAQRTHHLFSICMIDLDLFKQVNDTFGHVTGDVVLKNFADLAQNNIRMTDYLGRYGGEEFLLLLPETHLMGAFEIAQRLREKVEAFVFPTLSKQFKLTISIGVTEYRPGEELEEFVKRADKALYEAKHLGRNSVKVIA